MLALSYSLVIGASAELVGSAVNQPGYVQNETPAEHGSHKPGVDEGFIPEVHGDHRRQNKAAQGHQEHVVSTETNLID